MAKLALRLPENVPGDFFVDSTCIDCDACRQIAPETFSEDGDVSIVHHQPENEAETKRALMALVACPRHRSELSSIMTHTSDRCFSLTNRGSHLFLRLYR